MQTSDEQFASVSVVGENDDNLFKMEKVMQLEIQRVHKGKGTWKKIDENVQLTDICFWFTIGPLICEALRRLLKPFS